MMAKPEACAETLCGALRQRSMMTGNVGLEAAATAEHNSNTYRRFVRGFRNVVCHHQRLVRAVRLRAAVCQQLRGVDQQVSGNFPDNRHTRKWAMQPARP